MKRSHKTGFGLFVLLTALAVFLTGFLKQEDIYFQIRKNLAIFSELYKEISVLYIDEIPPAELLGKGIDAMLQELDPYTVYIKEGEQSRMEIMSSGSYGGVGLDAGFRGDELVVIAPLEGYPAERAGMRPGDVILRVDDLAIEGFTVEEFQNITLGDIGSLVRITIYRPSINKEITFDLVREKMENKNVTYSAQLGPSNEILYIQLAQFGQQSAEEIRAAMLENSDSTGLGGLILDLRNNPGGLLNEAVEIVDKFIEPGVTVVETLGRIQSQNNVYPTKEPAMFEELPVVILINGGSASASEIVSGALQDLDRAVVVGSNSFGKGLVQTIRPLPYNTSLKLTVSEYTIPSGRRIQAVRYRGDEGEVAEGGGEDRVDAERGDDGRVDEERGDDTREGRDWQEDEMDESGEDGSREDESGMNQSREDESGTDEAGTVEPGMRNKRYSARAFKTKNGRTVYDGNGIKPDIEMEDGEPTLAEVALLQSNHFFFFINQKFAEGDSARMSINPELFEEFLGYLDEVSFDYSTPADEKIEQLKEEIRFFKDQAAFGEEIRRLEVLSEQYKEEELLGSRSFILHELERQMIAQRDGRSAEQQFLLENDLWIDTALELIRNRDNYRSILMP